MKKLLCLIMFVICSTFLIGCATIEYQRIVNPDGSIIDSIIFEIDSDIPAGSANMILDDIYQDVFNYYVDPVQDTIVSYSTAHMDSSISEGIVVTLDPINKVYRTVKVTTMCANEELYEILSSQILPMVYNANHTIASEDEDVKIGVSVSTFIIKYIQKTTNAFGNIENFELQLNGTDEPVNFCEEYSKKYAGGAYHWDNSGTYNSSDIKLRQMYMSTDVRLNSNADTILVDNGFKMHMWELDANNPDFELVFYYNTANSTGWYYLALGITFVVMFGVIMLYANRTTKRSKATESETDIDSIDIVDEQ